MALTVKVFDGTVCVGVALVKDYNFKTGSRGYRTTGQVVVNEEACTMKVEIVVNGSKNETRDAEAPEVNTEASTEVMPIGVAEA